VPGELWDWRKSTDANPGREPKNRNFTTTLAREWETGHKKSTREANTEDLCGNGLSEKSDIRAKQDQKDWKIKRSELKGANLGGRKPGVGRFCGYKQERPYSHTGKPAGAW
jgi:hypothetical protein